MMGSFSSVRAALPTINGGPPAYKSEEIVKSLRLLIYKTSIRVRK
jgi:hypothetical protein